MMSHISVQLSMLMAPDELASKPTSALPCRLPHMVSPVEFLLWRSSICARTRSTHQPFRAPFQPAVWERLLRPWKHGPPCTAIMWQLRAA